MLCCVYATKQVVLGELYDTSEHRIGETMGILNALNVFWLMFLILAVFFEMKGYLVFDEKKEKEKKDQGEV